MCGRCAPHGQCAPGYAGALGIGSRQPVCPKGPAYPPDQQGRRPPAKPASSGWISADREKPRLPTRPARLKRGLGGSRNVHRRSEEPAPQEKQDPQYTSGQKGVLRTAGSKRLFRPFLSAQKGARRRSGETNPRQGLPKTGPAPGRGTSHKNPRHWPMPKIPPPGEGGRGAPPPKKQQHAPVPPQISGTRA